jgi:ribosomal protein S18 acetylase RimI-like enzyme
MIKFVVWDKEKLKNLTNHEKEAWFEVYNNGLVEDRGFSLNDPKIDQIKEEIKQDYFKFLHEYIRSEYFRAYFLLFEGDKIVSLCRVLPKTVLYLEGLETHRDYQNRGYATILLKEVLNYLKEAEYMCLRSNVTKHNHASIKLHQKLGFIRYDEKETLYRYEYKIIEKRRYYLDMLATRTFFIALPYGVPFNKDNNERYYKQAFNDVYSDLILQLSLINMCLVLLSIGLETNFNFLLVTPLIHLGVFIYANFMNTIRRCRVINQRYLDKINSFLFKSALIITVFAIISELLISLLV